MGKISSQRLLNWYLRGSDCFYLLLDVSAIWGWSTPELFYNSKTSVSFHFKCASLVRNNTLTHSESIDFAFISFIQNMIIMAPSHETEIHNMVATVMNIGGIKSVIRCLLGVDFGRDVINWFLGRNVFEMVTRGTAAPVGNDHIFRFSSSSSFGTETEKQKRQRVAIMLLATLLIVSVKAADALQLRGVSTVVTPVCMCVHWNVHQCFR